MNVVADANVNHARNYKIRRVRRPRIISLRLRQREEKRRAFAQFAFHPDLAAVALHDVFHNRKAQARAALLARTRLVHAIKPLEHPVERFRRNARPVVLHENFQSSRPPFFRRRRSPCPARGRI